MKGFDELDKATAIVKEWFTDAIKTREQLVADIQDLTSKKETAWKATKECEEILHSCQDEVTTARQTIEQLKTDYNKLTLQLRSITESIEQQKIGFDTYKLQEEEKLHEKQRNISKEKEELEKERLAFSDLNDSKNKEIEKRDNELTQREHLVANLESELQQKQDNINTALSDLTAREAQIKTRESDLKAEKEKNDQRSTQLQQLLNEAENNVLRIKKVEERLILREKNVDAMHVGLSKKEKALKIKEIQLDDRIATQKTH